MKPEIKECKYFDVIGAGQIQISLSDKWSCGGKEGFSFGVEWGTHGIAGGVLAREDAIKLAEHILKTAMPQKLRMQKLKMINFAI